MKLTFFVNDVPTEVDEYTTTRLALGAAKLGHDVWYVGAGDVEYEPDGSIRARGHRALHQKGDDLTTFLDRVKEEESAMDLALDEMDAVMLRNDSIEDLHARPWAVNSGIVFGAMLMERGVCVLNDPHGLSRAASKLYLQEFPAEIRPRCYVSRDQEEIKAFVESTGPTVLKPLYGAKGRNVFLVEGPDDPNLSQMIEAVLEDGYVFAQERVEGASEGDLRLFLLEGEALQEDGRYAAFRRVPGDNDVRANISTGGKPKEAQIGKVELRIAELMHDRLTQDGMFFVGIDIIGNKVVEINAESAGGLQSVQHFTGIDFAPIIIDAVQEQARTFHQRSGRFVGA